VAEPPKHVRASLARVLGGEKGAGRSRRDSSSVSEKTVPVRSANGQRRKAPRVGERPISSRKSGAARPSRHASLASARGEGGVVLSPRHSGQGRGRRPRQEVPEAIGVGAKSPS
jgi:hypothetical protein